MNKFFQNAFDKIGGQGAVLKEIQENTKVTAVSVSVGGSLYSRIDNLVTAIEELTGVAKGTGKGSPTGLSIKDSIAVSIMAPAMKPLGKGLEFIIAALNRLEGGEEKAKGLEAIVKVLQSIADIGKSVFAFAGYMALSLPLLMLAVVAAPLFAVSLFLIVGAIRLATKWIDVEAMKSLENLKHVGKGILVLTGSLALASLIMPFALKGVLGAALIILLIGGVFTLLAMTGLTDTIEETAKGLMFAGLAILSLGVSLALFSLIEPYAMAGMWSAAKIILLIGLAFALISQIDGGIKDAGMGLIFAAGAILSLGIALALFNIILPNPETAMAPMLVVGGVALAFALIGRGAKGIKEGAHALLWASLAIIVVGLSFQLMNQIIPAEFALDIMNYTPLLAIGAVALTFRIIGVGAKHIQKGAIAMLAAGGALLVISIGFMLMSKALGENPWTVIGGSLAFITGLGVVMGVAGLATPFILGGAAAMTVAGVALITIGAGLLIMNKVFKNTSAINAMLALEDGSPALVRLLTAIGEGFLWAPWNAAAILTGSGAMVVAGVALITIGKGLKEFKQLAKDIDMPALGETVTQMVATLAGTFYVIGNGGTITGINGEPITFTKGGWFTPNPVKVGVESVMNMGTALTGIAMGMQNMANLKFPTGFDKDGKATGYETMQSDAPAKVAENTAMLISSLSAPFAEIGKGFEVEITNPITGNKFKVLIPAGNIFFKNPVTAGIEAVQGMGSALTNIAKGVSDMAMLKMPEGFDKDGKATGYHKFNAGDALKVSLNTHLLIDALTGTFTEIGAKPEAKSSFWGGKSTIQKGIDLVQGMGEPLVNLAKGVQDMANLRFPKTWGDDGKPTSYWEGEDINDISTTVADNTKMLINALTGVFEEIGSGESKTGGWFSSTNFEKGKEIIELISEPYSKLGSSISTIAEAVMKHDVDKVTGKIKSFIGVFTSAGADAEDSAILNTKKLLINAIGHSFEKLGAAIPSIITAIGSYDSEKGKAFTQMFIGPVDAKKPNASYNAQKLLWNSIGHSMTKTGESMPKIAEGINAIDFDKLVETRKMFEALGVLSNGGEPSDILAQMGESLSEALQNLAEMLGEFKNTVSEGNEAQGGILSSIGDTVSDLGKSVGIGGGSDKPAPAQQAAPDNSAVVSAIKQLQSTLTSKGIKVKSQFT